MINIKFDICFKNNPNIPINNPKAIKIEIIKYIVILKKELKKFEINLTHLGPD